MGRKILLGALIFIAVGLVLLIYPDPQFRQIFSGGTASGFPTTRFTFNGTFPSNFTIPGGFRNFTRGAGGAGAGALINTNSQIESLLGAGLTAVGAVFVAIDLFLTPARPR